MPPSFRAFVLDALSAEAVVACFCSGSALGLFVRYPSRDMTLLPTLTASDPPGDFLFLDMVWYVVVERWDIVNGSTKF